MALPSVPQLPSVRPVPLGLPQDLAGFLTEVRAAVVALQTPQAPGPIYRTTTAKLPPASNWTGCLVDVSDLNTIAKSDGTNWRRVDTGVVL